MAGTAGKIRQLHADPAFIAFGQGNMAPVIVVVGQGHGDIAVLVLIVVFHARVLAGEEPGVLAFDGPQLQVQCGPVFGIHIKPDHRGARPIGNAFGGVLPFRGIQIHEQAVEPGAILVFEPVLPVHGDAGQLEFTVVEGLILIYRGPGGTVQGLVFCQVREIQHRFGILRIGFPSSQGGHPAHHQHSRQKHRRQDQRQPFFHYLTPHFKIVRSTPYIHGYAMHGTRRSSSVNPKQHLLFPCQGFPIIYN